MLNILLGNWAKIEIKLAHTVDTVKMVRSCNIVVASS